jgi:hypothetical protein
MTGIQANINLTITIEGLVKKISAWHAEETALRLRLTSMPEDATDRDRIESEADGLAEKIIEAEDRVSWIPAVTDSGRVPDVLLSH